MTVRLSLLLGSLMMLMTACGEDDGNGGSPDLLTGLSGFVILVLIIWAVVHFAKKKG